MLLKQLFVALAVLFGWNAQAKIDVIQGRDHTIYQVTIDRVEFGEAIINQKRFSELKLVGVDENSGILYEEGNPEIPVVRLYVDGDQPMISVGGEEKMALPKRNMPVKPVQPSVAKTPGAKAVYSFNEKSYKVNAFSPSNTYEVKTVGSVRGESRKMVTLYPISYNPATGALQYRSYFEVKVFHKAQLKQKDNAAGKEGIAFVVGQKFVNSPSLARYLDFKRRMGFEVHVIQLGTDVRTDDQIRAKLKEFLALSSSNLRYAVLVGDIDDVPSHRSSYISGVTDHYYASIDTDNYESDIGTPDIGVGRISVSTEEQLAAVVEKSIEYQRGVFHDEAWLNKIAYLATDDRYQVAEGTHNYAIDTYTRAAGYTGIFPQANQPGGDKLYPITYRVSDAIVNQAIAEGRTIVDYSGHGAETYWAGPNVTQADVRALNNQSSLPFVISNACITGNFRVAESFAETWLRHRYGAILFWGSMDSTYWDEDDILERRMFDGIYAHQKYSFKDITQYAQDETWRFYGGAGKSAYYAETYHLFGDPSILLRTTATQLAVIEGPTEAPIGLSPLEYRVKDTHGNFLVGAHAAFISPTGVLLATAVTDANGMVSFSPPEDMAPGSILKVIVTGFNLRESEAGVQLISPNAPFLNLANIHLNGRGELLASANEEVAISMNIKNVGMVATQGAMLAIESIDGPATVVSGSTGLPAIPAGGSMDLDGSQFRIHINADAVRGDTIRVNFMWTTTEGATGRASKNITVARGEVGVVVDFGNPDNRIEGGIQPGSDGPLYVTVTNTGNEAMNNLVLSAAPTSCVSAVRGSLEVTKLAPGESMRISTPLNVAVLPNCHSGEVAELSLVGTYAGMGGVTAVQGKATFMVGVISVRSVAISPNLAIPDNRPAVDAPIVIDTSGSVIDIGVRVQITHSYVGDLIVELVHPDGTVITLRRNEGGSLDNIDVTYGMGGTPVSGFAQLVGKPMNGVWKVRVQDNAGSDTGTLNSVTLNLKGYAH